MCVIEIHKIQKETVTLLNELYKVDRLAVTPAMLTIQNGYYPDIESILKTLKHYRNVDRVKIFLEENKDIVEETEEYLEAKKTEQSEPSSAQDDSDIFGDIFGKKPQTTELFDKLKSINLDEFERSFTEIITAKLNEEIKISVKSVTNKSSGDVEINLVLSK